MSLRQSETNFLRLYFIFKESFVVVNQLMALCSGAQVEVELARLEVEAESVVVAVMAVYEVEEKDPSGEFWSSMD